MPSSQSPLFQDTAVQPLEAGRYRGQASGRWSYFAPSGGVLMSTALRASREALGESEQIVCSATAVFAQAVAEGPVDLDASVWRRGGGASQVVSSMFQGAAEPALTVTSTFARARAGVNLSDARYPDVPHWSDCPEWPHPSGKLLPFFENFEERKALGHAWVEEDWPPGPPRYARWIRYRQPPRTKRGELDVIAFPPVIDMMPPAVLQGMLPDERVFLAPSLDLTVHFYTSTKRDWLLLSSRCRQAAGGLASTELEVWDEDERLLAYGTQVMMLRKFKR